MLLWCRNRTEIIITSIVFIKYFIFIGSLIYLSLSEDTTLEFWYFFKRKPNDIIDPCTVSIYYIALFGAVKYWRKLWKRFKIFIRNMNNFSFGNATFIDFSQAYSRGWIINEEGSEHKNISNNNRQYYQKKMTTYQRLFRVSEKVIP